MWMLWQFQTGEGLVVTRGRTQAEAEHFLRNIANHTNIKPVDAVWIDAAWMYSTNHPFNWLDSPPRWISYRHEWLPPNPQFRNRFHPPLKRVA